MGTTFPTSPAFEAAVVAAPDEDTPRLAYADWLDEHGDPDRAGFIRVQCQLADLSPADPDWVELNTREDELAARLCPRMIELDPPAPHRFYFGLDMLGDHEEPFRRGFPYFIACQMRFTEWTPDETDRVADDLLRLVRTTTIRGFHPYEIPADRLAQLLATPAAVELSGLALMPEMGNPGRSGAAFLQTIATSPALRRVRHLALYGQLPVAGGPLLTNSEVLGAIRRLTISVPAAPRDEVEKLTAANWFNRLQHLRTDAGTATAGRPWVAGLGNLPDLHTLDLTELAPPLVKTLAGGAFRSLARLKYGGPLDRASTATLATARFPELVVLEVGDQKMRNDAFLELLRADWFGRLRVLDVSDNAVGDKAIAALAAHPAARTLRVLRLGDNSFGKTGLMALAKPGAFPALLSLDLRSYLKRKASAADLVAFLSALHIPRLRHLDLKGWPLGDAGAKALAASPALAGVTRLDLSGCGIGDPGAKALFASPHLQNLVYLRMEYNSVRTAADALADPAVMPRLGECWLNGNKIPAKSASKLARDGLYLIT